MLTFADLLHCAKGSKCIISCTTQHVLWCSQQLQPAGTRISRLQQLLKSIINATLSNAEQTVDGISVAASAARFLQHLQELPTSLGVFANLEAGHGNAWCTLCYLCIGVLFMDHAVTRISIITVVLDVRSPTSRSGFA